MEWNAEMKWKCAIGETFLPYSYSLFFARTNRWISAIQFSIYQFQIAFFWSSENQILSLFRCIWVLQGAKSKWQLGKWLSMNKQSFQGAGAITQKQTKQDTGYPGCSGKNLGKTHVAFWDTFFLLLSFQVLFNPTPFPTNTNLERACKNDSVLSFLEFHKQKKKFCLLFE